MRFGAIPESLDDIRAYVRNDAPIPLIDTALAYTAARAVMGANAIGLFGALGRGPSTTGELAAACGTDPAATGALLRCLVAMGYADHADGRFSLPPRLAKWLLPDSPSSLRDKLDFQTIEWRWVERLEDYLRTGEPIDMHAELDAAGWLRYERGMRALAAAYADELASRVPVRNEPRAMVDIGGGHGLLSHALCGRFPDLVSTIVDLPNASAASDATRPTTSPAGRIRFEHGDARSYDFGTEKNDIVLFLNVAHHLSAEQNVDVCARIARSLTKNGVLVVGEYLRRDHVGRGDLPAAINDLYFALTSASGTWSANDVQGWQRRAGLHPSEPMALKKAPGYSILVAHRL
jgi:hypothetical protein